MSRKTPLILTHMLQPDNELMSWTIHNNWDIHKLLGKKLD